jgi:anti-sigma B factor antagonist
MITIDVERKDKAVIVSMTGELSLGDVEKFENAFKQHLNSKLDVIALDLKQVQYLNSFGMSRILKISRAFSGSDTEFVLLNMNDNIYQIFRMSTFDKIFKIFTGEEFKIKYLPAHTYDEDMYSGLSNSAHESPKVKKMTKKIELIDDCDTIVVFPDKD